MEIKTSDDILSAYNEQYSDASVEWRELGAKYKAGNIISLCGNDHFNKVLDCGAGEGSILKFLHQSPLFHEFYAIEISRTAIEQIEKKALPRLKEVKRFDGYAIPYPDNTFDLAYCSHVIEHVEHPRYLLREIKRVSKKQIFEIPLDYFNGVDKKINLFLSYGHLNIYTPSLFRFLLKSEGFILLNDSLTDLPEEVRKYIKMNIPFITKLKQKLARKILSPEKMNEFTYQQYTCLTESGTRPAILVHET